MTINPTRRLNRLTEHAQNLLQSDFSDWAAKDRISSNFDRLNSKMLAAYNRCGGGSNGIDNDEDEPSKGILFRNPIKIELTILDFRSGNQ